MILTVLGAAATADARKLRPIKPERIVRPAPGAERPALRSGGDPARPTSYARPHHLQLGGAPVPVFDRKALASGSGARRAGPDSTIRVAVIRVEFATDRMGDQTTGDGRFLQVNPDPDRIFIDTAPHDDEYFAAHIEAVNRYWNSMTYGCVEIEGEVFPRNSQFGSYMIRDMADYGPQSEDEFFSIEGLTNYSREALIAADADPDLDWKDWDVYFVVHAGADWQNDVLQDTPLDLPTFSIVFSDSDLVISDEGDTLSTMITYPESMTQDGFLVALNGGIAHEMGHQLGLFDLYNIETFAPTVAFYDVMDSGNLASVFIANPQFPANEPTEVIGVLPTAIGAWSRWFVTYDFGIHPTVIKEDFPRLKLRAVQSRVTEAELTSFPRIKKWVQLPISDTEYFLVENRVDDLDGRFPDGTINTALDQDDSTGVVLGPVLGDTPPDVNIPSHNYDLLIDPGVLIWHVDERQALANLSVGRGLNVDFEKRSVTIEEADGLVDIGNPFSLFYQGTDKEAFHAENNANFTPFSRPNSNTNLGPASGISVTSIGVRDTTVAMDIGFGSKPKGWPMELGRLGTGGRTSTTAADADGDGRAEIAAVVDSAAWLFRYDDEDGDGDVDPAGSWPAPAVPLRLFGNPIWTQALGDLDGEAGGDGGALEMIVATDSGAVHVWNDDGTPFGNADSTGVLLSFPAASGLCWSAVPADLDGDGADELYGVTYDGFLRGWDAFADTVLFGGRPLLGPDAAPIDTLVATLGFGDLGGDSRLDGLVAYVHGDSVNIQRFDRSGSRVLRVGWPLPDEVAETSHSRVWLGIADVNRDPDFVGPELFLATEGGWLMLSDPMGRALPGWPIVVDGPIGGPPAFGDLDSDGLLEIAIAAEGRTLHAFNYNATEMSGWPITPSLADFPGTDRVPPGPVIADVNGDGVQDVVAGFSDFTVRAFDTHGDLIDGFPIVAGAPVSTTPAILDANGDGRLEMYFQTYDGHVYARILGGIASSTNPAWGMLLGGPDLHGSFDPGRLPPPPTSAGKVLAGPVDVYPNPVRNDTESVRIRYTLDRDLDPSTGVEVVVYNLAGEEVLVENGTVFPNSENVLSLPAGEFSSGVYLCRLRAHSGSREETRLIKFAVIR